MWVSELIALVGEMLQGWADKWRRFHVTGHWWTIYTIYSHIHCSVRENFRSVYNTGAQKDKRILSKPEIQEQKHHSSVYCVQRSVLTFLGRQKPGRCWPLTSAAADLMSRCRSSIRASWLLASSFYTGKTTKTQATFFFWLRNYQGILFLHFYFHLHVKHTLVMELMVSQLWDRTSGMESLRRRMRPDSRVRVWAL